MATREGCEGEARPRPPGSAAPRQAGRGGDGEADAGHGAENESDGGGARCRTCKEIGARVVVFFSSSSSSSSTPPHHHRHLLLFRHQFVVLFLDGCAARAHRSERGAPRAQRAVQKRRRTEGSIMCGSSSGTSRASATAVHAGPFVRTVVEDQALSTLCPAIDNLLEVVSRLSNFSKCLESQRVEKHSSPINW